MVYLYRSGWYGGRDASTDLSAAAAAGNEGSRTMTGS